MNRSIYLDQGGVHCAAGQTIEAVWQHLASGRRALSEMPCESMPEWPWPRVFTVEESGLCQGSVDRKVLRTMEKQAKLALQGAGLAMRQATALQQHPKHRIGLYLGLPVVEDPAPPWPMLETMAERGERAISMELALRETPPFWALSELNSSACAHIAGAFGLTGAMGVYSHFADAGLQALMEAALSITEQENDAALVGGVSQKINPYLLLHYERYGWLRDPTAIPGEGAAFVALDAATPTSVRLGGWARGFACTPSSRLHTFTTVLEQACTMAGVAPGHIDWVLPAAQAPQELAALQTVYGGEPPLGGCAPATGQLGPASPLLNLLLAAHGMRSGKRLRQVHGTQASPAMQEEHTPLRHTLVTAYGPEGQYAAVVLSQVQP